MISTKLNLLQQQPLQSLQVITDCGHTDNYVATSKNPAKHNLIIENEKKEQFLMAKWSTNSSNKATYSKFPITNWQWIPYGQDVIL